MLRREPWFRFLVLVGGIFTLITVLLYSSSTGPSSFSRVRQQQQRPSFKAVDFEDEQLVDTVGDTWNLAETTIPSARIPGDPSNRQYAHVDGFTVFDNIYLRNGVFYVVTTNPDFPPRTALIGKWDEIGRGTDLSPTDNELQFITPQQAPDILGDFYTRVTGFTVFVYDPAQFMHHYYHWWGEVILGMWRVYSALALGSDPVQHPLPFPSRFILPAVQGEEWRDKAGVDGPLMRATFPQASIEKADYWRDLVKLNTTFMFDRSMIINRDVAHKHANSGKWFKMVAGTMAVQAPENYWEPIRASLVRNLLGYLPEVDAQGRVIPSSMDPHRAVSEDEAEYGLPIVTYISRQGAGRRLTDADHVRLVESLQKLEDDGICKFQMPMMERLSIREQIALVAKSTIIVGVHGNGLTHQLMMPTSLRSAVFEIWDPPSYTFDYEMLARNVGHKHYGVQNDTIVTYPKGTYHEGVHFTPGFHGIAIPVYGPVIADKIRQRLTQPSLIVED